MQRSHCYVELDASKRLNAVNEQISLVTTSNYLFHLHNQLKTVAHINGEASALCINLQSCVDSTNQRFERKAIGLILCRASFTSFFWAIPTPRQLCWLFGCWFWPYRVFVCRTGYSAGCKKIEHRSLVESSI